MNGNSYGKGFMQRGPGNETLPLSVPLWNLTSLEVASLPPPSCLAISYIMLVKDTFPQIPVGVHLELIWG